MEFHFKFGFVDSVNSRKSGFNHKGSRRDKKLIEDKVMPDIKEGETVEEIKRKQELARNLVAFSGVEAAYYTARGLMIAVYFSLLMHYAYKFVALTKPKSKESEGK